VSAHGVPRACDRDAQSVRPRLRKQRRELALGVRGRALGPPDLGHLGLVQAARVVGEAGREWGARSRVVRNGSCEMERRPREKRRTRD
jgi:hypothetical protein